VITSFVLTAAVTLAASIAGHLLRPSSDLAHLPSLDPRQDIASLARPSVAGNGPSTGNSVVATLSARDKQLEARRRMWSDILDRLVLSLSDQQLATCFAILATALIRSCQISMYHLDTVCDLAWFSTITHLLSIIVLRHYWLQDSKKVALYVRSVLIICAFIMILYVVAVLMGWGGGSGGCPAVCVFLEPEQRYRVFPNTIFAIAVDACIIFWVYPTTCLFVFPLWYKYYHLVMWKLPGRFLAKAGSFGSKTNAQNSHVRFGKGIQVIADIYRIIFFPSQKVAIVCQVVLWCFRLIILILDRLGGPFAVTDPEAELTWGFGQLLAVIIVFLPFLTLLETWSGELSLIKPDEV